MNQIKPSLFAKFFSPLCINDYLCEMDDYEIVFSALDQINQFGYLSIKSLNSKKGFIWSRLKIEFTNNKSIELTGLNDSQLLKVNLIINEKQTAIKKLIKEIEKHSEVINKNGSWLKNVKNGEFYISESEKRNQLSDMQILKKFFKLAIEKLPLPKDIIDFLLLAKEFHNNPEGFKENCNDIFIPRELSQYKDFFDNIEKNPLTEEQRKAIITNEDSTLVVASAGSGKTSLLVGKVSYLIDKGMASADQILVLAFNKSSKEEVAKRLDVLDIKSECQTFHSFGLKILAKSNKKKSSLAGFIENNQLYSRFIQNKIEDLIKNSSKHNEIKKYFVSFFRPYQDQFNFNTLGEYYQYIKSNNLVTLKGGYVKSMEELEICNFLHTNNIEYDYEKKYEYETATIERRQYKPDFYLPKYNIYIEHFALNKNNETPSFINQDEYLAGVKWKREIHKKKNTTLIETYSYQKREGNLTESLENKLKSEGVIFKPIDPDELFSDLNTYGYISEFTKICGPFLNLFKGRNEGFDILEQTIKKDKEDGDERILFFVDLFKDLFLAYEEELKKLDEIDFHDMINQANKEVLGENCYTKFKYILVDEFQDISFGRAKLIQSLQRTYPSIKLLAVGDDWQSIYRFTGSDINLMTNFKYHFGYHKQLFLTKTFRFNSSIEKVASKFIRSNPNQIDKEITAQEITDQPNVKLFFPNKKSGRFLETIVEDIYKDCPKNSSILFLGRNNRTEEGVDYHSLQKIAPSLTFEFRTVHKAKGYEADYVIILELKRARSGFPNEIIDDPIINAMLSENEGFDYAEERRLFYVALTRAKHMVYVIAEPSAPSIFFNELAKDNDYYVEKINLGPEYQRVCPLCKSSPLAERTSKDGGMFFGCQNFPLCDFASSPCRLCNIGYLKKDDGCFICDNNECKNELELCPRCENGYLHERSGQYGLFLGCSNYRTQDCKFTRKLKRLYE